MSDYLKQLEEAKPTVTITPSPLILEKGQKFRGMYVGQKRFDKVNPQTGEIESKPVAHFFDGNKVLFNMGAQLTRAIEDLPPGVSVEIELVELKKNGKGGNTKIYSVTPLDMPIVNLAEMFGGFLNITPPATEHLIAAPATVAQVEEAF